MNVLISIEFLKDKSVYRRNPSSHAHTYHWKYWALLNSVEMENGMGREESALVDARQAMVRLNIAE